MLLSEAKEILEKNGYMLSEDAHSNENIWFNGSRAKLAFDTYKDLFFITNKKSIAIDYIDDGETVSGYLNTFDISNIKKYIFDYRTDFKYILGKKFKASWSDETITIDETFKKILSSDWNKWSLKYNFERMAFINQVLIPMGYKGYYNVETDNRARYESIGIFVKYLKDLKVIDSEKIDIASDNDEDEADYEEDW